MDKLAFPPEFDDAQKAFALPLGMMASPLWFAFAGAATAGAAFFWMSRWREATNLEAALVLPAQEAAKVVEEVVEEVSEVAPETVAEVIAAVVPEPVALEPDDLTRLVGIGPKLAASLAERGVTRFEHIAAWTADDIAATDQALKLLGRIERDAWVAQAKRFSAEA